MNDNVNHPSHYTSGKVECIDALDAATAGLQGIEAVCTANAIKYLWRWRQKNGIEDLEKAVWYINHLIKSLSPDPEPELENEWEKQAKEIEMTWKKQNMIKDLERQKRHEAEEAAFKSEGMRHDDYLKEMERRIIERIEKAPSD